ncbi:MAG: hypothetical protein ACXVBR_11610 [Flavisolibacter sp.]
MQIMKWVSITAILALIASCFFPWISIESRNIVATGFHAEAVRFGKPGWIHLVLGVLFIFLVLLNRIWSLRTAFFISAFNIAWAVRNFIALSSCSGGECPTKHPALYVVLIASILAAVCMLFIEKKTDPVQA